MTPRPTDFLIRFCLFAGLCVVFTLGPVIAEKLMALAAARFGF